MNSRIRRWVHSCWCLCCGRSCSGYRCDEELDPSPSRSSENDCAESHYVWWSTSLPTFTPSQRVGAGKALCKNFAREWCHGHSLIRTVGKRPIRALVVNGRSLISCALHVHNESITSSNLPYYGCTFHLHDLQSGGFSLLLGQLRCVARPPRLRGMLTTSCRNQGQAARIGGL